MKLAQLIRRIEPQLAAPVTDRDVDITGLAYDSRNVAPGDLFIALAGLKTAGAQFAAAAVRNGAVAVVSDAPPAADIAAPWIAVSDAREAMAALADEFFEHPSGAMQVVGITGTNGKTTTAYLMKALFEAAGMKTGMLGTVSYMIGDQEIAATRTTPESVDVHRMLRQMVDRGCRACVMEVSSHALALRRVDQTTFAAGVFTNLTRDHLDYHKDMESYFAAKRRLFELLPPGAPGVINADDPRGEAIIKAARNPVTYAIAKSADVTPGPLSMTAQGVEFDARTPKGAIRVRSRLIGRPNVFNILAAVATATSLDLPALAIERGLSEMDSVPGRFQVVSDRRDDITVVVDYAHTDDALRNLLDTARPLAHSRLITVFGCGGDRDRTKRPLMGAVASRLSDVVIVTSDNPRTEDPTRIIEEIKLGVQGAGRERGTLLTIVDRHEAVDKAIAMAEPGDMVLLAGKGHEKTQVVGTTELPFDEPAIAREALDRRRSTSRVH